MEAEIREVMRIIDKSDLNSLFAYEEVFATFLYYNHFSFPYYLLKSGSLLWRTRNNENKPFENFSDLSCPDSTQIHKYSRANKPHQNMFYLSDYYDTTFMELMPSWSGGTPIGGSFEITISTWELKKDLFVMCIPEKSNPDFIEVLNNKFTETEIEFLNWITDKFSANTIENPNVYKFTSALCNVFLTRQTNQKIWGTLYPSVHKRNEIGKGFNIALIPESCDFFELKQVFRQKIRKTGERKWNNFENPTKATLNYDTQQIIWEN